MQLGFVIDHESCIGCHACTVACKAENSVPVGNFRTSVKYVEQGLFPDVRRMFLVQRCNHCSDAPCVTICPVNALEKRKDGIVDVDRDACIGCRACMQACPYDAIYLNDDLNAVEKCHFCAHRVEKNLEPACVIVCPVGAIITGDFDDPHSRVSLIVRNKPTKLRRPEQNTGPNVAYVGVADVMLEPGRASRPTTYFSSDRPPHKLEPWPASVPVDATARVVLDQGHRVEWGWGIALYLVTKAIAGGAAMLAPFAGLLGLQGFAADYLPEVIALIFIGITGVLLVEDLKKPGTFLRIFTRPNWRSWLVKGAWIINAFVMLVMLALGLRFLGLPTAADVTRLPAALAGAAVAGYTAFLFMQCEGRDLWQSRLLLPHLIVQAALCGAVALMPFDASHGPLLIVVASAAVLHGLLALLERFRPHETDNAKQGAAFLNVVRLGPLRPPFRAPAVKPWRDGLIVGVGLTLLLTFTLPELAFIPAIGGLLLYEYAFIRAGQLPPLS